MEIGSRVVEERVMGLYYVLKGGSMSYFMVFWLLKKGLWGCIMY